VTTLGRYATIIGILASAYITNACNKDAPSGTIEWIEPVYYCNDMWSSRFFEIKLAGCKNTSIVGDTAGIECGDDVYIDERFFGKNRAIKK